MTQTQSNIWPGKLESISAACHHLSFFNNVAVSAHYRLSAETVSNLQQIMYHAVADVVRRHPILSAIPVNEDTANPYFGRLSSIDLQRSIFFATRAESYQPILSKEGSWEDEELDLILEIQHNINFKLDYGSQPFWRLIILQNSGTENKSLSAQKLVPERKVPLNESNDFTACFVFHHALCDGISGLILHNALQDALETST